MHFAGGVSGFWGVSALGKCLLGGGSFLGGVPPNFWGGSSKFPGGGVWSRNTGLPGGSAGIPASYWNADPLWTRIS